MVTFVLFLFQIITTLKLKESNLSRDRHKKPNHKHIHEYGIKLNITMQVIRKQF